MENKNENKNREIGLIDQLSQSAKDAIERIEKNLISVLYDLHAVGSEMEQLEGKRDERR